MENEQGKSVSSEALLVAAERTLIAAVEFVNDRRKGDFELPRLAQLDAQSLEATLPGLRDALDAAEQGG